MKLYLLTRHSLPHWSHSLYQDRHHIEFDHRLILQNRIHNDIHSPKEERNFYSDLITVGMLPIYRKHNSILDSGSIKVNIDVCYKKKNQLTFAERLQTLQ